MSFLKRAGAITAYIILFYTYFMLSFIYIGVYGIDWSGVQGESGFRALINSLKYRSLFLSLSIITVTYILRRKFVRVRKVVNLVHLGVVLYALFFVVKLILSWNEPIAIYSQIILVYRFF